MRSQIYRVIWALIFMLGCANLGRAQAVPNASAASQSTFTAEYPKTPGVFIQSVDWLPMSAARPSKTKAKHAIAASLSYGAVPATVTAEYAGAHAQVQLEAGRPVICLCHLLSLPGTPALVRLHAKKDSRELDGGKMIAYPIVGGSKIADANQSDLIAVETTQPESLVWLVRPEQPLAPGEYALMLGTQNMSIFPFAVVPVIGISSTMPAAK
ncbi:MAG: hypothetical protein ABSD96_07440 [Candidatus Korobacteraceae bacterium]